MEGKKKNRFSNVDSSSSLTPKKTKRAKNTQRRSMADDTSNQNSSPPMQPTTPASGDETDVSPPAPDEVTESGRVDSPGQWIEQKCVFCCQELREHHEPKLLQCLHTACKSCLTSETANSPASSTNLGLSARQVCCPICNQEVNIACAIDHLFLLEHISQSTEGPNTGAQKESKSYPCTSCEEGADASGFCQDCQEWLCDTCVNAHHRVRVTKDHIIRPKDEMENEKHTGLSQKYLFCQVHVQEQLKLYCETCDKLTCRDCQLSDHKDHKYQFLSKACEEEKITINSLLSKIREKQNHIDSACELVNKRHGEITQREQAVTQEIKHFAVKFITEINKRGKQLLQELSDVCTNKKTQLSYKHNELINMGQRLDFCLKFAEAALSEGSETALVFSKRIITDQLRKILRHRCEVPNPQHMVDIGFSFDGTYLSQYISHLGTLMVDQQPVPRITSSIPPTQPMQQQNQHRVLPVQQPPPQPPQQQPPPQPATIQHGIVRQNSGPGRVPHPQQQVALRNQVMPQHMNNVSPQQPMQQKQQQQQQHYGQPQVTSSTDHAQNMNAGGTIRNILNSNQALQVYSRNQGQRNMPAPNTNSNTNFNSYMPRQVTPQQSPIRQPAQQNTNYQQPVTLPAQIMGNTNLTISAIPSGPTPPKQRAVANAPRQNASPLTNTNRAALQRLNQSGITVQPAAPQIQQQQQQNSSPQVIVIDGDGPGRHKTPTMSTTSRLSHFPAAAAAALSANPAMPPLIGLPELESLDNVPQIQTPFWNSTDLPPQRLQVPRMDLALPPIPAPLQHVSAEDDALNSLNTLSAADSTVSPKPSTAHDGYFSSSSFEQDNIAAKQMSSRRLFTKKDLTNKKKRKKPKPFLFTKKRTMSSSSESYVASEPSDELTSDEDFYTGKDSSKEDEEEGEGAKDDKKENKLKEFSKDKKVIKKKSKKEKPKESDVNDDGEPPKTVFQPEKIKSFTNDDYCSVCHDGGELLCCNLCPRVFHYSCHLPVVSQKASGTPQDDWSCRMCLDVQNCTLPEDFSTKRKLFGLNGRELILCERILLELYCHEHSSPFHFKVDKKTPSYYKIIQSPMDMSKIRTKLTPNYFDRYKNTQQFRDDVRLMLDNCCSYNGKGTELYDLAKKLDSFFTDLLQKYGIEQPAASSSTDAPEA